jgi:hypothetical protein
VLGRKLLGRPKRSRNEAVVPYEEELYTRNRMQTLKIKKLRKFIESRQEEKASKMKGRAER